MRFEISEIADLKSDAVDMYVKCGSHWKYKTIRHSYFT